jgi:hypothetical protein
MFPQISSNNNNNNLTLLSPLLFNNQQLNISSFQNFYSTTPIINLQFKYMDIFKILNQINYFKNNNSTTFFYSLLSMKSFFNLI